MKFSLPAFPVWLAVGAVLLSPLPAVRAQAPQAAPNLTPKRPKTHAAGTGDATPDPSVPVATVNGVAVYRPLLRSSVASPVDRALLILAYHKNGAGMSSSDKDFVTKQMELSQFDGDDKRLDAKLKTLGATRADYRQYAVEETKIHDMLRSSARSQRSQTAFLAELRRNAAINTARH